MDFSDDKANELIKMPKFIAAKDSKIEKLRPQIGASNINMKYQLLSEDGEYEFLLEITQSKKLNIKINLHFQEDDFKIGLLRVDYNGQHTNPQKINMHVPIQVQQFAGKKFIPNEHHMHIHVQGYSPLAWAIPLVNTDFPIKEVTDYKSFTEAIIAFAQEINVKTKIILDSRLFL